MIETPEQTQLQDEANAEDLELARAAATDAMQMAANVRMVARSYLNGGRFLGRAYVRVGRAIEAVNRAIESTNEEHSDVES